MVSSPDRGEPRIVFCLHGIRTRGEWTKDVTPLLSKAGFTPVPLDYGHFSARQLRSDKARRAKVDWLRDKIARECERLNSSEPPSIIAHSFGTYLVAKLIEIYDFKFDKIIFCGAIVPTDYNWPKVFNEGNAGGVLNQHGAMDFWAHIVSRFVRGTGPSGYLGFDDRADERLVQQGREEFRHGDYFYDDNFKNQWIPFLSGDRVRSRRLTPVASASFSHTAVAFACLALVLLAALFALNGFNLRGNQREDLNNGQGVQAKAPPDPFLPNSVWMSDSPRRVLSVIDRKDKSFQARFELADDFVRDVTGTIKDGKLSWFAKDVRVIRGDAGGDNYGTIMSDGTGDRIDFVWRADDGTSGTYSLRLRKDR